MSSSTNSLRQQLLPEAIWAIGPGCRPAPRCWGSAFSAERLPGARCPARTPSPLGGCQEGSSCNPCQGQNYRDALAGIVATGRLKTAGQ